jgi:membrane protein YdbS with pleckstrin-like domain
MTLERSWRLLPSERVLWHGRPARGVARDLHWLIAALLLYAFALVAALFCALLYVEHLPGIRQTGGMAVYLVVLASAALLAPSFLHDPCEYLVTEHRIMWRRGRLSRWIDRKAISYARIVWNATSPGVGHLELVRATPFGPLSRRQRLVLHNVIAPDRIFACIRGVDPVEQLGDPELLLTDRLDRGERVVWGGGPQGFLLGWRDVATALLGAGVIWLAMRYGGQATSVLVDLERLGLQVRSWTWLLLFLATALSWSVIASVGAGLVWHGLIRARALGRDTEYVLTNRRVLIRRGRTELSLDRRGIVDVAVVEVADGCRHLFLILDAPEARALSDSGAMTPITPARDVVPPVLYELRDTERLCELLLEPQDESDIREAA